MSCQAGRAFQVSGHWLRYRATESREDPEAQRFDIHWKEIESARLVLKNGVISRAVHWLASPVVVSRALGTNSKQVGG
jgi:hypothetical protein